MSRTDVRRQLNFQDENDHDEAERKEKTRYMRRLELMMQADGEKRAKDEKEREEKSRRKLEEQFKGLMEKKQTKNNKSSNVNGVRKK